jgi:uncharacterized membrane protein YkoI
MKKLMTVLLTSTFLIGGLGAHAMIHSQQVIEQTYAPTHTINQLTATNIALNKTNGGLVTNTQMIEDNDMVKYEISIENHDKNIKVNLDAKTGKVLKFDQHNKG